MLTHKLNFQCIDNFLIAIVIRIHFCFFFSAKPDDKKKVEEAEYPKSDYDDSARVSFLRSRMQLKGSAAAEEEEEEALADDPSKRHLLYRKRRRVYTAKEGGGEKRHRSALSPQKGREFAPTFNFPLLYASWRRVRPTPMSEHLFSPTDRPRRRRRMKRPDPPELRAEWTH